MRKYSLTRRAFLQQASAFAAAGALAACSGQPRPQLLRLGRMQLKFPLPQLVVKEVAPGVLRSRLPDL